MGGTGAKGMGKGRWALGNVGGRHGRVSVECLWSVCGVSGLMVVMWCSSFTRGHEGVAGRGLHRSCVGRVQVKGCM